MRRIQVDNARRKQRIKHGGQLWRIDIETLDVAIILKMELLNGRLQQWLSETTSRNYLRNNCES